MEEEIRRGDRGIDGDEYFHAAVTRAAARKMRAHIKLVAQVALLDDPAHSPQRPSAR